jgi:hypothetical protein
VGFISLHEALDPTFRIPLLIFMNI